MRRAVLAIVFLLSLAAAGVAFLPATLVDSRIAAATGGKLRLQDAAGTVWSGRGALGDAAGVWRMPLAWRIDPLDVVRGMRQVTLLPAGDGATPRGTIGLRDGGIATRDLALELPSNALAMLLPKGTAPVLGGTLAVTSPALTFERGTPSGTLEARWTGARLVAGDAVADLGTVRLMVKPRGNGLAGTLTSDGGDVRVDGTLTYAAPLLRVDATLTPGPETPAAVTRALALAGTPDAAGRVRIAWRGNVQ